MTLFRTRNIFQAFRSLGETITAHVETSDESFPLITLPNFELSGHHARLQSRAESITFAPIVPGTDKSEWEQYALMKFDAWMQESKVCFKIQHKEFSLTLSSQRIYIETEALVDAGDFESVSIPAVVQVYDNATAEFIAAPEGNPTYTPIWMTTPPPLHESFANVDFYPSGGNSVLSAVQALKGMSFIFVPY